MARRGDGLYLRGATWWVKFIHQGTRYQLRIGKGIPRTVAREIAQVKRVAILKGEVGLGRKRADVTFDDAAEKFLTWAAANKRPRTARTYRQCLEALAVSFAGKRLSAISAFDIERHKQVRLKAGVRVMANREREVLRALYNRCREWGLYEGDNPVEKVKGVRESEGRLRFLDEDEEDQLLAEATAPTLRPSPRGYPRRPAPGVRGADAGACGRGLPHWPADCAVGLRQVGQDETRADEPRAASGAGPSQGGGHRPAPLR